MTSEMRVGKRGLDQQKLLKAIAMAGGVVAFTMARTTFEQVHETSASMAAVLLGVVVAYGVCDRLIRSLSPLLLKANRSGRDLNKPGQPTLPESLGVAAGAVYAVVWIMLLPVLCPPGADFRRFGDVMATLVSVLCMLLVGFVDDVVDLKWRHKTLLPAVAGLPLMVIYRMCSGKTTIVLPRLVRPLVQNKALLDLGMGYYLWMQLCIVFCTHSINILAGVNGVEVGQAVVIAVFAILHNVVCIVKSVHGAAGGSAMLELQHWHSLQTLLPFVSVGMALLKHNWWPAKVFVGDTWCYFAGMTLSVAGVLGHYTKTLLGLFGPQLANFALSLPQLAGVVPCPRHRLPRLNGRTGLLEASTVEFSGKSHPLGVYVCRILQALGLVCLQQVDDSLWRCTNLTVLNALLVRFGPMREDRLAIIFLLTQATWCVLVLYIRHSLSRLAF